MVRTARSIHTDFLGAQIHHSWHLLFPPPHLPKQQLWHPLPTHPL